MREFEKLPPGIRDMTMCSLEEFHGTRREDIRHIRGEVWSLRVGSYRICSKMVGEDLLVGGPATESMHTSQSASRLWGNGSRADRVGPA